ncbi:MAG: hypothetical protein KIS66_07125 [Fimbriimonadaceae bacterium]|nr:hypothetical protein [Fimbriimonadaceae bacterium]
MIRRLLTVAVLLAVALSQGQDAPSTESLLAPFKFRSIGPAVTGGRIVDIEVPASRPNTIYAASASGGLWKSVNGATTWTPVFDDQKTISIGDVAIAPSDPDVVWVGTGEHNNQRSAHFGDGVYRSLDGGKTWKNMGLPESNRIGRIAIHPRDPKTVYVAACGYLYKPGGDRGVYKTTDGGETWSKVLSGDNDTTGFIDVVVDPRNPKTVYAAAYDRLRRAWNIRDAGPGSKIYRSNDEGKSWKPIMEGITKSDQIGRIGLTIYPKNPRILYAVVDNRDRAIGTEVYRTDDGGDHWMKAHETRGPSTSYYYGQIRVDPNDDKVVYNLDVSMTRSKDAGKTWQRVDSRIHVDHHALWINPADSDQLLLGNDGGLYRSYDQGATWQFLDNLPVAQFYAIGADNAVPYNVMGGLQDNGVWHGPSRTRSPSGIANKHWINLIGGDGFYAVPDPEDPNTVYTSSQFGAVVRADVEKRQSVGIRPRGPGQRANWMSPFLTSPHNARIVYWGGNRLYRTLDRGTTWDAISPDLTTNDADKLKGNVPHCTITTVDESPKKAGVLWVGTDDGNVWVTQDGGVNWTQVDYNIAGAPRWWVSRVVASPHDAATAFVTFTGFREDEFQPFLFRTTDFGATWTALHQNLPKEQVSVVRQDRINPNLLFVGTETGCHVSLDGGKTWTRFMAGMPTVACQDLLIHPREGDLVVGTHGRGVFIANVSPLRQLTEDVLKKDAHLFQPDRALAYNPISDMFDAFQAHQRYAAPNPPSGATIAYYLRTAADSVTVVVTDVSGAELATIDGAKTPGINVVQWNMRQGGRGLVPAGKYRVALKVGDKTESRVLEVEDWQR